MCLARGRELVRLSVKQEGCRLAVLRECNWCSAVATSKTQSSKKERQADGSTFFVVPRRHLPVAVTTLASHSAQQVVDSWSSRRCCAITMPYDGWRHEVSPCRQQRGLEDDYGCRFARGLSRMIRRREDRAGFRSSGEWHLRCQ